MIPRHAGARRDCLVVVALAAISISFRADASGTLPASSTTTLLHALTVDPDIWDATLAVPGAGLPPQRWVATWPDGRSPAAR